MRLSFYSLLKTLSFSSFFNRFQFVFFFSLILIFVLLLFLSSKLLSSDMDSNPYRQHSNFIELLSSQRNIPFAYVEDNVELSSSQVLFQGTQGTKDSNFSQDTPPERTERRKWTPTDDTVLIRSWLNTSKDLVVGNEQRSGAFWKRIAA